jgi:hypothetical protein
MEKRLFERNDALGITEYWHYDEDTDTAHIEAVQDVEQILDVNRAAYNATDERARYGDGVHLVARIPLVVLQELRKQGIASDPAAMKKWLNDPENKYFRTRPGRV